MSYPPNILELNQAVETRVTQTAAGDDRGEYVIKEEYEKLQALFKHFLKVAGAELRGDDLVFSSEGYGLWTKRKGDQRTREIAAQNEHLKALLQEFVDFDIREQDNWASPCAYCRLNNRGEDWEEPHADDCVITKAEAITAKS